MHDSKRHPAAHFGVPAATAEPKTSEFPKSPAATHDMKLTKPAQHPAPHCSPKVMGSVKHPTR